MDQTAARSAPAVRLSTNQKNTPQDIRLNAGRVSYAGRPRPLDDSQADSRKQLTSHTADGVANRSSSSALTSSSGNNG